MKLKTTSISVAAALVVTAFAFTPAGDSKDDAIAKQKKIYPLSTCVVSDEKLGEHVAIADFVYEGRLFRFCCNGCIKDFKKDPEKYVKKLDDAVAAKQKKDYPLSTCVVSDKKLGSMGDPVDYVHEGRLVRFCCGGCVKKFKADPAKFLSKMGETVKP